MRTALLSLLVLSLPTRAAEPVTITPGADLAGWTAVGGTWQSAEGVVGSAAGTLVSPGDYADFVFRTEFRAEPGAAVGLQLRSHVVGAEVLGLRVTLAGPPESPYGAPGSVAVTLPGGKLQLLQPAATAAKIVPGKWHSAELRWLGDELTVLIDATETAKLHDERAVHGRLALTTVGGEAHWRGLTIEERGHGEGWTSLFNGTDLTGWVKHGEEQWGVVDGCLVGQAVTNKYGYLATERTWTDVEVRIDFQCIADGNSGLFFHSTLDGVNIRGVQCEISALHGQSTAGLYESAGRGWLAQPDQTADAVYRPHEWNTMRVLCRGNRMTTWLNGYRVCDVTDDKQKYKDGVIALQLHSGGQAGVKWRELWVREVE